MKLEAFSFSCSLIKTKQNTILDWGCNLVCSPCLEHKKPWVYFPRLHKLNMVANPYYLHTWEVEAEGSKFKVTLGRLVTFQASSGGWIPAALVWLPPHPQWVG